MIVPSIYPYLRKTGENRAVVNIMCYFKTDKKHFVRIACGLNIDPKFWVESSKSPTVEFVLENPEWYERLKSKLKEVELSFASVIEALGEAATAKAVKGHLDSKSKSGADVERESVKDLASFIQWYIKKQEYTPFDKRKSEGTVKQYVKILNRLLKYYKSTKKRMYLAQISMDEVDACVVWFERQKQQNGRSYSQNSIQDHEKWLIALTNKAVANRFECPMWNPKHSEGRVAQGQTDDIHFDLKDLQKLMIYEPCNELERNALVWSVIGYCTGLRHSDWMRCYELLFGGETSRGESVSIIKVNGTEYRFLHMCPHKTRKQMNGRGIWCGIPVLKPIEEIIRKHGLPKPAVDQVMNRNLKEIAINAGIDESYTKKTQIAGGEFRLEKAMKGDFMTTHKIGRVSFITQFSEFIPKPILVKITAHVGGKRDAFDGYIKDLSLKRNAERFIAMLQDHQGRGEFSEVDFV